jgi:hypothetical protein
VLQPLVKKSVEMMSRSASAPKSYGCTRRI